MEGKTEMPLKSTLQPHQERAVNRLRDSSGLVVNHGLGSGKTLTSIAAGDQTEGKVLVVAPASLIPNFRKELDKHYEGNTSKFTMTSIAKFRKDPNKFLEESPSLAIFDEFHRARNPGKYRDAVKLTRKKVPKLMGLTASLVNNHPADGVRLALLVDKDNTFSEAEVMAKHVQKRKVSPGLIGKLLGVDGGTKEVIVDPEGLRKTLSPHIDRFTGTPQYKENLPDVDEETVEVPLSKEQVKLLKGIMKANPMAAFKVKRNLPPGKKDLKEINVFMNAARQVSTNPKTYDDTIVDAIESSPKYQRMLADMREAEKETPNNKTVIYSRYLGAGLAPLLDKSGGEAYTGKVSKKKREEIIRRYNEDKLKVLGISPAGGEGIDLKGTKHMLVTEPDWNPETLAQAKGRAVRYKSHHHLPEEERRVKIRNYISVYPKKWYHGSAARRAVSPEQYLLQRAKEKSELNRAFLKALEDQT